MRSKQYLNIGMAESTAPRKFGPKFMFAGNMEPPEGWSEYQKHYLLYDNNNLFCSFTIMEQVLCL